MFYSRQSVTHEQLYVALSRPTSATNVTVLLPNTATGVEISVEMWSTKKSWMAVVDGMLNRFLSPEPEIYNQAKICS